MITVKNTVYCCLRSSLFILVWISSVHTDKVLALLRFRKVYVLKVRFSKTVLQITEINFLPTISYPNRF